MKFLYHPSHLYSSFFVISLALAIDLILGDPIYKLHPVRMIGRLINMFYKLFGCIPLNKRFLGAIIVFSAVSLSEICYIALCQILNSFRIILDIFLCYSLIALKDLSDHIQPIIKCLEKGDIKNAQRYLSRIVGRDTEKLNRDGIIRASVESIAEGFLDGFFSPVFWFFVGILSGYPIAFMLLCKVINTLDSMLGYKSPELVDIGFASAKLDDFINFIPARICLIVLFIGAALLRFNAKKALFIALRDRLKHTSPNSAHPEAFVAGALGIRLGGPTYYPYGLVKKPWIGDNEKTPDLADIKKSMKLIIVSGIITIPLFLLFSLLIQIIYADLKPKIS